MLELKPDAPLWMQHCGMGWVFCSSEPRRLLGRYAYYNTMFLWLLLKNGWEGDALECLQARLGDVG